jgi:hypothetical protein
VSATLYEADSGRTVWSQRFDRPDNNDEWNGVIAQIWGYCTQASDDAEIARAKREHPDSLDKRDLVLAARARSLSSPPKRNFLASIALVERALAIDPDYVPALDDKAKLYEQLVANGYSSDASADLSTAARRTGRAAFWRPKDDAVRRADPSGRSSPFHLGVQVTGAIIAAAASHFSTASCPSLAWYCSQAAR